MAFFDDLINALSFNRKQKTRDDSNGGNRNTTGNTVQAQADEEVQRAKNLSQMKQDRFFNSKDPVYNKLNREAQYGMKLFGGLTGADPNKPFGDDDYKQYLRKDSDNNIISRTINDIGSGLMQWDASRLGKQLKLADMTGDEEKIDNALKDYEYAKALSENYFGKTKQNMYDRIVMNGVNNLVQAGETMAVNAPLSAVGLGGQAVGLANMAGNSFGGAYGDVRTGRLGEQYADDTDAATRYGLANAGNELIQEAFDPFHKVAGIDVFGLEDFAGEFAQESLGAVLDPYMETVLDYDPVSQTNDWMRAIGDTAKAQHTDENGNYSIGATLNRLGGIGQQGLEGGIGGWAGGVMSRPVNSIRQVGTDVNTLKASGGVNEALRNFDSEEQADMAADAAMADLDTLNRGFQPSFAKHLSESDRLRLESTDVDADVANRRFKKTVGEAAKQTLRNYVRSGAMRSSITERRQKAFEANERLIRESAKAHNVLVKENGKGGKLRESQLEKMITISNALGIPFEFKDNGYFIQKGDAGHYNILSKRGAIELIRGEIEIPADPSKIPGVKGDTIAETFMHEVMHVLEGTPEYNVFVERLKKMEAAGLAKDKYGMFGGEHVANVGGDYTGNYMDMDPDEIIHGMTEQALAEAVKAARWIEQNQLVLYDPEYKDQWDHRETTQRLFGDDHSDVKEGEFPGYNGEREWRTPNNDVWEHEKLKLSDVIARTLRLSQENESNRGRTYSKYIKIDPKMLTPENIKTIKKAFKTKDNYVITALSNAMGVGTKEGSDFYNFLKKNGGLSEENISKWIDEQQKLDSGKGLGKYKGVQLDQEGKVEDIKNIFETADIIFDKKAQKETPKKEETAKEVDLDNGEAVDTEIVNEDSEDATDKMIARGDIDIDEYLGEKTYLTKEEVKGRKRGRDEFKEAIKNKYKVSDEQLDKAVDIIIENGGYNNKTVQALKENGLTELLFKKDGGTQQFNPKDRINALYDAYAPVKSRSSIIDSILDEAKSEEPNVKKIREDFEKSLTGDDKKLLDYLKANGQKFGRKQGEDVFRSSDVLTSKTDKGGDKRVVDVDGTFLGTTVNDVYRGLTQDLRQLYLGDASEAFGLTGDAYVNARTEEELRSYFDRMKELKADIDDIKKNGINAEYFERNGIKELSKADAKALKDAELSDEAFERLLNLPADMSYEDKLKASMAAWKDEETEVAPKKKAKKNTPKKTEQKVEAKAEAQTETVAETEETPAETLVSDEQIKQGLMDNGIPKPMAEKYGDRFEDSDIVERLAEVNNIEESEAEEMLERIKRGETIEKTTPQEPLKTTPQETPQEVEETLQETVEEPAQEEVKEKPKKVKPANWLAKEYIKLGVDAEVANRMSESKLNENKYGGDFSTAANKIAEKQGITYEEASKKLYDLASKITERKEAEAKKKAEAKKAKAKDKAKAKAKEASKQAEQITGKGFTEKQQETIAEANEKVIEQAEDKGEKVAEMVNRAAQENRNYADEFSKHETVKRLLTEKESTISKSLKTMLEESYQVKPVVKDEKVKADAERWLEEGGLENAVEYAKHVNEVGGTNEEGLRYMEVTTDRLNELLTALDKETADYENAVKQSDYEFGDNGFEKDGKTYDSFKVGDKEYSYEAWEALKDEKYNRTMQATEVAETILEVASEAGRVLRTMQNMRFSPDVASSYLDRLVKKFNKQYESELGKTKIKLSDETIEKYKNAKTDEERAEAMRKIEYEVADQLPRHASDMIRQWRMTCMLLNPRTHIRNIVSNGLTYGLFRASDYVQAGLENALYKTGILKESDLRAATNISSETKAAAEWLDKRDKFSFEGPESDKFNLLNGKLKAGAFSNKNAAGRFLNKVAKANTKALEMEDEFFVGRRARLALAQSLTAQGYTVTKNGDGYSITKDGNEINERVLHAMEKAALKNAQEATYHDFNRAAKAIEDLKRNLGGWGQAIDVIVPFTKTPGNILRRSIEFSPLGLAKSVTWNLAQVKQGKMSASTAVTQMSRGLTGTAMFVVGALLANLGVLSKPEDDEEKTEYYKSNIFGKQDLALHIGDKHYSIDWAMPSASPLMMGASTAEMFQKHGLNVLDYDLKEILSESAEALNPVLEASYLGSLNDFVSSIAQGINYGGELMPAGPLGAGERAVESVAENFVGQLTPTVGGAINRTLDSTKRTTSGNTMVERMKNRTIMNIPGMSGMLEPAIDQKGNQIEGIGGNVLGRALYNFASPSTITVDTHDETDEKLLEAGEGAMPRNQTGLGGLKGQIMTDLSKAGMTIGDITSKEYTKVKQTYYGNYNDYVKDYTELQEYNNLSGKVRDSIYGKLEGLALAEAKATYYDKVGDVNDLYTDEQKAALAMKNMGLSPVQFYMMKTNGLTGNRKALYVMSELETLGVADEVLNDIAAGKYKASAVGLTDSVIKKTPDEREEARNKYLEDDGETLESLAASYRSTYTGEEKKEESTEKTSDSTEKTSDSKEKASDSTEKTKSSGSKSTSSKSSTTKKTQAEKDAESAQKAMLSAFTKAMSSSKSDISASVSGKSVTDLWDSIVNGNKKDVEALRKELKL